MGHTPGPWRTNDFGLMGIGIRDEKYPAVAKYAVHVQFCPLFDEAPEIETEEFVANMRIMGASLDLLEACRQMLDAMGHVTQLGNRTLPWDMLCAAAKAGKKAIAKAEGREEG